MNKICDSLLSCKEKKVFLFTKNGYAIQKCRTCDRRFALINDTKSHLQKVYSDDYFIGGKGEYPNYLEEKDLLYKVGVKYAKLIAKYTNPGEVLDVGCAAGFILKGFENAGWRCHAIEPNDTMASYGRNILNLDIQTGNLETFTSPLKFDLVNLIQVISHLYDLDKSMINLKNLVKPGGFVLVETWDMKSWIARLMGRNWHEYNPPDMLNWFSPKSLTDLFAYYGFEIITSSSCSKKISMNHTFSIIAKKYPNVFNRKLTATLKRMFGKLTLIYPPLDLKWYLFKKL